MRDLIQHSSEWEIEHQKDLERIRKLRLIDDDFMNVCFDGYIEGTELVLQIILEKPDIKVRSVKTQKVMKNLLGRDIWLDVNATDSEGVEYNIEIQRTDKGADFKRARYHSSILDAHLLQPSEDFSELPETYVIFITENDVIGANKPIYTVERQIITIGQPFSDGEHIIYVNGADKNSLTALGRLMHDFFCTDPNDMYYSVLSDKVRYFKQDEKGESKMCKVLEEMKDEAEKRGEERGEKRGEKRGEERMKIQLAKNLIEDGELPLEKIAKAAQLTIDRVRELAAQKAVPNS